MPLTLLDLVKQYGDSFLSFQYNEYFNKRGDQAVAIIPESIANVFAKMNSGVGLDENEISEFRNAIKSSTYSKVVLYLLISMATNYYSFNQSSLDELSDQICSGEIDDKKNFDALHKILHDYYMLLKNYQRVFYPVMNFNFPNHAKPQVEKAFNSIPYALNSIELFNQTKNHGKNEKNAPIYPMLVKTSGSKVDGIKGKVEANDYYPIKKVNKIYKGDTGDNTFMASNGKDLVFVRGVETFSSRALFSSSVAILIDSQYFANEVLMDNGLACSPMLPTYHMAIADENTKKFREKHLKEQQKIIPGTGQADEVTNFIREGDPNTENFGLTSLHMKTAHVSKIDYDRCNINFETSKEEYEINLLTTYLGSYRKNQETVRKDPSYLYEKLRARLKLSFLTKELFACIADCSYLENDGEKQQAINASTRRTDVALELFIENDYVFQFMKDNPSVVDDAYQELLFAVGHSFPDEYESLKYSIEARKQQVEEKLLKIKLTEDSKQEKQIVIKPIIPQEKVNGGHVVLEALVQYQQIAAVKLTRKRSVFYAFDKDTKELLTSLKNIPIKSLQYMTEKEILRYYAKVDSQLQLRVANTKNSVVKSHIGHIKQENIARSKADTYLNQFNKTSSIFNTNNNNQDLDESEVSENSKAYVK